MKLKKKEQIESKALMVAKKEVSDFLERLKNKKYIGNLFCMPTPDEIEHSQWLMNEISLFLKISLADEEDKLEDIWDDLFFDEKAAELQSSTS